MFKDQIQQPFVMVNTSRQTVNHVLAAGAADAEGETMGGCLEVSCFQHVWTDERKELLRKLWAESPAKSARFIAAELGGFEHTRDGGRNAVIGKAQRLGLPRRERRDVSNHPLRDPNRIRSTRPKQTRFWRREGALAALAEIKIPDEPIGFHCSLVDLQEETACHWPVTDDSPFLFCGAPKRKDSSYCTHHFMRSLKEFEPTIQTAERAIRGAKAA